MGWFVQGRYNQGGRGRKMDFGMMIETAGAQRDPLDRLSEDPSFRSASTERWYSLRLSRVLRSSSGQTRTPRRTIIQIPDGAVPFVFQPSRANTFSIVISMRLSTELVV